jgi:hypothetical protein
LNTRLNLLIRRTTFVILAFLFWRALVSQLETFELSPTHFFFALFIYCFYRLIASFFQKRDG